MSSKQFKKGKYYIGDPCYVIKEYDEWNNLLKETNFFDEEKEHSYRGLPMLASRTAYGDGCYEDNKGREYSVDAGLLGIIPLAAIDKNVLTSEENIIDFKKDFIVTIDDGIFEFDNIVIDTREHDDDDCNQFLTSYDEEDDQDPFL